MQKNSDLSHSRLPRCGYTIWKILRSFR